LHDNADVKPSDITAMSERAPHQAHYPGTDNRRPFNGPGNTLMSAQFCVAVAASRGGVRFDDLAAP
jgi:hypothetical protein